MGWKDYIPFLPKDPPAAKPKLNICCACPDTKAARDECIAMNGGRVPRNATGEEDKRCQKLIEAHKVCLRAEGFNV